MKRDFSISGSSRGRARKPIEVAMTPMIDVIFLLLVFFVATSSFQMVELMLPSGVSEVESDKAQGNLEQPQQEPTQDAIDQVIVELNRIGEQTLVTLNDVALPAFSSLEDRLKSISLVKADTPVVIDPDDEVQASEVIQAYDWAREAGLSRVFLAVSK